MGRFDSLTHRHPKDGNAAQNPAFRGTGANCRAPSRSPHSARIWLIRLYDQGSSGISCALRGGEGEGTVERSDAL